MNNNKKSKIINNYFVPTEQKLDVNWSVLYACIFF